MTKTDTNVKCVFLSSKIYKDKDGFILETMIQFAILHTAYAVAYAFLSSIYFICWYFPAENAVSIKPDNNKISNI